MEVEMWGGVAIKRKSKTDTQNVCGGGVEIKKSEKNRDLKKIQFEKLFARDTNQIISLTLGISGNSAPHPICLPSRSLSSSLSRFPHSQNRYRCHDHHLYYCHLHMCARTHTTTFTTPQPTSHNHTTTTHIHLTITQSHKHNHTHNLTRNHTYSLTHTTTLSATHTESHTSFPSLYVLLGALVTFISFPTITSHFLHPRWQ